MTSKNKINPKIDLKMDLKIRDGFEEQRKPFAALRELQASLNSQGFSLDTLSMGMTADYAAAIHEGATIVRIGTALFGERE